MTVGHAIEITQAFSAELDPAVAREDAEGSVE